MGVYCTVAELRAEPEVPDASPPADPALEALIAQAEDQIDEWLGARAVIDTGASAGRKVAELDVQAWQWTKLKRATVRLAARLHADPALLRPAAYGTVKGPEFEKSAPLAGAKVAARLADVIAPLNASGLRVLGGRAA